MSIDQAYFDAFIAQAETEFPEPVAAPRTPKQRDQKYRAKKFAERLEQVAVLDMETDPFDNVKKGIVLPYLAVLHSECFDTIIIWEQDHELFIEKVIAAIVALPDSFTIYAHNGGKFDFMFFVHKLRGKVSFKGRGIMGATIGNHELRDSYHIIPERLAAYKKDDFDYSKLTKAERHNYKETIIKYCVNDCVYLLDLIKKFLNKYGFKISIGAAAMAKVKENYKIETLADYQDKMIRPFFAGGRVECIMGLGHWVKPLKLIDVNSMYPDAMANKKHPVGSEYLIRPGAPSKDTAFLTIECDNNGALMTHGDDGGLCGTVEHGIFKTTIWEYNMAMELGLIDNVRFINCVDNFRWTDFAKFVLPLYELRAAEKDRLATLEPGTPEYDECNANILFYKLILNNAYGKFAQNPRRFKEYFLTDPYCRPEQLDIKALGFPMKPEYDGSTHWIWSKPIDKIKFNNVGTSASITGAARAKLMHAKHLSLNPVYCDTDSLICEEPRGLDLHPSRLGAWDVEKHISELIVCGKKLYAYKTTDKKTGMPHEKPVIRSKGSQGISWDEMLSILAGEVVQKTNFGPTLTRRGDQAYITRNIRSTGVVLGSKAA